MSLVQCSKIFGNSGCTIYLHKLEETDPSLSLGSVVRDNDAHFIEPSGPKQRIPTEVAFL